MAGQWLQFILSLQGPQQAARVRIWRALRAMGAAVLRDGVYLLPFRPPLLAQLQALALETANSSGTAQILSVHAWDEQQAVAFRALFDRTAEYLALMQEIARLRTTMPSGDATPVARLRRDFESIVARDFFPGEAVRQVSLALDALAAARGPDDDEPSARHGRIRRLDAAAYRGRLWATRRRPWADRLGSAWLIRRFIDPQARFAWLRDPKDKAKQMVGFDFDGADFTHVDGKVTFEVLMGSFALDGDPGLRHVADVVHYLDVGGLPPATAAGFEALLRAARTRFPDDDELFVESAKLFELLYLSTSV
jgi:hypothetical protein